MYEHYMLGNICKVKGMTEKEANEVLSRKNRYDRVSLSKIDDFWLGYTRGQCSSSSKKVNTTNNTSVERT